MWPQFRSPLMWDVFAVNTYLIVSSLFWYMGLIPDLALLRDRAKTRVRKFLYGLFALGWTGSARHWHNYEKAYLVLSGLATLLVFTVSSIVGMDFATSQLAGWHETIFPFYFVAGAVFCGFGMVLVLLIPLRKWCHLEDIITMRHIDRICKMTLMMGCIMGYIYVMEYFIAWYSGNPYDAWVFGHRLFGHYYWFGGWIMIVVNALLPQLFWFKKVRQNLALIFVIAVLINIGMWFERFIIIVGSLVPGFPAVQLASVLSDLGGRLHVPRHAGRVFHHVPFVRPVPADDRRFGGQSHHAAGRPASSARRRERRPPMNGTPYGLIAEFDSPAAVLHAAEKVRDAGFRRWDVFSPFPVHGLDKVMGFKNSLVGWFALVFGGSAFIGSMLMIWYMNGYDYPILDRRQTDVQPAAGARAFLYPARAGVGRRGVCRHGGAEPVSAPVSSAVQKQPLCPGVA